MLKKAACLAVACLAAALPARALTNAASTAAFGHVGTTGASGVLIAPNWVLTAAHAASLGTFASGYGSAAIDAFFRYSPGGELFENDIALLHLAAPLATADRPILNDLPVPLGIEVTLASARNASASPRAYGVATLTAAYDSYDDPDTPAGPVTVNWLETAGPVTVESGDSGSALFEGRVLDSGASVLLGVASAVGDCGSGVGTCSFYVQTAPYRAWIDATLGASGQQALWTTSAVPEPASAALLLAGLGVVIAGRPPARRPPAPPRRRRRAPAAGRS